ncbi:MAG: 2-oxoglutarate dehydrogenase complex dihydrolipoyllysine-residue succinyltransferase [Pseudohongiellaceae bacterium]
MTIEIKAPTLPESVPDGTVATWHKKPGDAVAQDEVLVDIETDKVVIEVPAPSAGTLKEIIKAEGETIVSNELIAILAEGAAPEKADTAQAGKTGGKQKTPSPDSGESTQPEAAADTAEVPVSPAARKLMEENSIKADSVKGSGKDGRITKEDVLSVMDSSRETASEQAPAPATARSSTSGRLEERVPMSRLRARIAERLLDASQSTAMLTTFNEVDMSRVMAIRSSYRDEFEKAHDGVRLGFMSFFVRACVEALKRFPGVNASLDGSDVVYHGYQDIGVAVSSPRGLVVPVIRDADHLGLAETEKRIREFGLKAREGKLAIEDMTGGTFTISNGGVFGSLLSTPILNPPQTAILGMHKIQDRPMAVDGEVKILPMMYLALSYDHRMIDGKEAVQFLVTVKELLEDPARILLEI